MLHSCVFVQSLAVLLTFAEIQGDYISMEKVSWQTATEKCNQLFTFNNSEAGAIKLLKDTLSPGDEFWIGARAIWTRYVTSWSCATPNRDAFYKDKYVLPDNSIASCMKKCGSDIATFTLQGDYCFCGIFDRSLSSGTRGNCTIRCPGNINDKCGGLLYMNVYATDIGTPLWNSEVMEDACLSAYVNNNGTLAAKEFSCDNSDSVRGYICRDKPIVNDAFIKWQEANEKCENPGFNVNVSTLGSSIYYWIPKRRSSLLVWGNEPVADYPMCVSVKQTDDQMISIKEQNCNNKHRFICADDVICATDNSTIGLQDEKQGLTLIEIASIIGAVCGGVGLLVIIATAIIVIRKRKADHQMPQRQPDDEHQYDQMQDINI